MISGIIPVFDAKAMGIPYLHSIRSFADVCDEIVIITSRKDPGLSDMTVLAEELTPKCNIKIRGVDRPKDFEVFRVLGYNYVTEPGWIVHFDGDYLISPENAQKLRQAILDTPEETDIITYVLAYLNYDATMTFRTDEMAKWWPPHDGFRAEFPFVLNLKRGMSIAPFEGLTEDGIYVNMEGVICHRADKWGKSFNTKFQNHNPYGFNIVRSEILIEHLTWSMDLERAKRKADEDNHMGGGVGWEKVRDGDDPWEVSYPLLDEVREMYALEENGVSAFDGSDKEFLELRREQLSKLQAPKYFIDVGPGYPDSEAWLVKELWPDTKIIGFEANPENRKRLIDAGYPGELYNIAVSDKSGELTLYEIQKGDLSLYTDSPDRPSVTVSARTLDDLSEEFGPFEDAFIWADIEGAELSMLRGASKLFGNGNVIGVNMEVRDKPYSEGWCSAEEVAAQMKEYDFELHDEYGHVTGYVDYRDAIYVKKQACRIKVVVLHHNMPGKADELYSQLVTAFDDVELLDSGSDPDKIPTHLTLALPNVYWEGAWLEAMKRWGDYDVVWMIGADVKLQDQPADYRKAIEEAMPFGCWSPSVEGRAHPFMLWHNYNWTRFRVKNVEGMALAVSGSLIRAIGGKFEVSTKVGFGQDYWLCAMARKHGMANYIDGSVIVLHPAEIGYNESEAHKEMEKAFGERYGADFRRTLFEYKQDFKGNLFKENSMSERLTIASVDNGWGVKEFNRLTEQLKDKCRLVIMKKGISDFSAETDAEVIEYDPELKEILAADVVVFTRVGSANNADYEKVINSGIPVVVKHGFQGDLLRHEENGFVYGHESWGIGWLEKLVSDKSLRDKIRGRSSEKPAPQTTLPDAVQVSIITPTYRRDPRVVSRCIDCVKLQTISDVEQLVCSDGAAEPQIASLVASTGDVRITYQHTTLKKPGDFGNVVRQTMLEKARGKYILFLDDDNLILPNYLEKMIATIEASGADFAVCQVVHFGPLNEQVIGRPPQVLKGLPVKLHHVDPLQILVKREAMLDVGWDTEKGYLADGHTLQALGEKYKCVEVPEVLGFHM